ncbi:MAG: hypothetical protein AAB486_01625 [Patescibacteria group bacterium]
MNTSKMKRIWIGFWHEEGFQLLAVTLGAAVILPLMSLLSIQTGRTLTKQLNLIGSQSNILSEKIKNIEEAAATLAPFEKDRPRVDLAIPDEQSPAQLLNKINLILGEQQLTLLSLRMDKATVLKNEVTAINIYLEFTGFYPNIAVVLREFETDTQQFDMGSLRISRRREDFQLEANLVLKTYYYRKGAADEH